MIELWLDMGIEEPTTDCDGVSVPDEQPLSEFYAQITLPHGAAALEVCRACLHERLDEALDQFQRRIAPTLH